jgi:DNA-binding response OmpR family regulator
LSLPTKNGWDALEELKAKNPLLSVIIITAKSDGSFSALSSGVGVLLKKPLHFVKLFETVSYLLTESVEARLERIAGKRAAFHYLPAKQNALL